MGYYFYKMSKKIKPIYKKCRCGKRITNHHIYCNKCWKRKESFKDLVPKSISV